MAELWTFSGINSWVDSEDDYVDYVAAAFGSEISQLPSRSYISRLGTAEHYDNDHNVFAFDAETKLDEEANKFAAGDIESGLSVSPSELSDSRVCALFVAPKTDTRPGPARTFECVVHWSPYDPIPNQGIFKRDSLTYWRKWGAVYPVSASHKLNDFLNEKPTIKFKRFNVGHGRAGTPRKKWVATKSIAPNPVNTIGAWLDDTQNDIVIVGHSQGVNIAMAVLARGFDWI